MPGVVRVSAVPVVKPTSVPQLARGTVNTGETFIKNVPQTRHSCLDCARLRYGPMLQEDHLRKQNRAVVQLPFIRRTMLARVWDVMVLRAEMRLPCDESRRPRGGGIPAMHHSCKALHESRIRVPGRPHPETRQRRVTTGGISRSHLDFTSCSGIGTGDACTSRSHPARWLLSSSRFSKMGAAGTFITIDPTYDLFTIVLTNHGLPDFGAYGRMRHCS